MIIIWKSNKDAALIKIPSIILNNSAHTNVNGNFPGVAEMDLKERDDFEISSVSDILLQLQLKSLNKYKIRTNKNYLLSFNRVPWKKKVILFKKWNGFSIRRLAGRYTLFTGGYAKMRHNIGSFFIIHFISIWFKI